MTEKLTNLPERSLRDLIADDSYVVAFQTVGHYRTALLQYADALTAEQTKLAAAKLNRAARMDDGQGEANE
jgi:hypothetical protein